MYLVDSSPEFLGALLHANDELGTAINSFKQLDSSIDADSDSEDEMAEQQHIYNGNSISESSSRYLLTYGSDF